FVAATAHSSIRALAAVSRPIEFHCLAVRSGCQATACRPFIPRGNTACAQLLEQSSEAPSERVYRTGSNLPVHERTSSGRVLTLDRDAAENMIRRSQPMPSPVKGGAN